MDDEVDPHNGVDLQKQAPAPTPPVFTDAVLTAMQNFKAAEPANAAPHPTHASFSPPQAAPHELTDHK